MRFDWKVRFKNPMYIGQLIVSIILPIILPILAYYNLTLEQLTSWDILFNLFIDIIKNPYVIGMIILNILNATIDPRSKGVGDNIVESEEFEYENYHYDE